MMNIYENQFPSSELDFHSFDSQFCEFAFPFITSFASIFAYVLNNDFLLHIWIVALEPYTQP